MPLVNKFLELIEVNKIDLSETTHEQLAKLAIKFPQYFYFFHSLYYYYHPFKYLDCFQPWSEKYVAAIKIRKRLKAKRPKFTRYCGKKHKRLKQVWRNPQGIHNKKRIRKYSKGASPKIGYGVPKIIRFANNKGYHEVVCSDEKQMLMVPKTHMVRLSKKIGFKKRLQLEWSARNSNKYIVNPTKWSMYLDEFRA